MSIIYDTITSVLFWAYDFSEHMILCVYDLCADDLSVGMIFSERMICVYDLSERMIFMTMLLFL